MASPANTICWPTNFISKWLAVFFGAALIGVLLGAITRKPKPPPPPPPQNVTNDIYAYEVDAQGRRIVDKQGRAILVPAFLQIGSSNGGCAVQSDSGPLSTDWNNLTPLSRPPGTQLCLIFKWHGDEQDKIATWQGKGYPVIAVFQHRH